MAEIKNVNGRPVIDYMARDYDSLLRSMRELIPEKLPEWTDYESEADFGNVLLQLFAHMGDILSYYQDRVANESFLATAQTRRSIIQHLRLIGYRLATAAPASAKLNLFVPSDFDETITIRKGDAFATDSQKDKPSVRFEYALEAPLTIDCSALPVDPVTKKKYFGELGPRPEQGPSKGIPVEEGRLVRDEVLGESDGHANQRFSLAHPGLILRSLGEGQAIHRDIVLITRLGGKVEEWTLRESLAFSHKEEEDSVQNDFSVEIDEQDRATLIFGDGVFGAIPPQYARLIATYRVGGGRQGNVPAHTIKTIIDAPQLAVIGADVTNPQPATGGAERESIEHAVAHAPRVFRSRSRAVTGRDYEDLALDLAGVGKVRAVPTSWNAVKLCVAPQGGGHVSDILRASLLAYFEDKRPVSTLIEVEDVDYVRIYVTAEIGVESYYDRDAVKEQVLTAAGGLLAFDRVDFGQILYLSKFYEAIEAIDGVTYVTITEFGRCWGTLDAEGKIKLEPNEIPRVPGTFPDDPDGDAAYADGIRVEFEGAG
jgi:uncharacterized phage protein gp47/JayE